MKKNKMINAATCDARAVTEESLTGYENITINAATLIVNERSKELLNKYPVTMNVANVRLSRFISSSTTSQPRFMACTIRWVAVS